MVTTANAGDGTGAGPGATPVGPRAIVVVLCLFIASALVLAGTLATLWPAYEVGQASGVGADTTKTGTAPSGRVSAQARVDSLGNLHCIDATTDPARAKGLRAVSDADCVRILWWRWPLGSELRLLLLALVAGAFGATIHTLRSIAWYVGNRALTWSWLASYAALPAVGMLMGGAFYIVIRGGLWSLGGGTQPPTEFGVTAVALLVGMFTTPAALKLKKIAESVFEKANPGADHAVDQSASPASPSSTPPTSPPAGAPAIGKVNHLSTANGGVYDSLSIAGENFAMTAVVLVDGQLHPAVVQSSSSILLLLTPTDIETLARGGVHLVVKNPDGVASAPFAL